MRKGGVSHCHSSCSLNCGKGGYIRDYIGDYCRGYQGRYKEFRLCAYLETRGNLSVQINSVIVCRIDGIWNIREISEVQSYPRDASQVK